MILRAIRVAECGRFSEPVALEGLSGGLDVLVGPNEAGKSTLLKAMRLAFQEKHRSNNQQLRELRPYSGGAPLVEVEFELAGESWRLRKRFLAERMAELISLTHGHVSRGADAENALEGLFGSQGLEGRLSLMWLGQGSLLTGQPGAGAPAQELLRSVVAAEIANAAGGEAVRRLRAEVGKRLEQFVTSKQERKRGRYAAAEVHAKAASAKLASARAHQQEVETLMDRLAALERQAASLSGPEVRASMRERLERAEDALRAGRESSAARDRASTVLVEARGRHRQAAGAVDMLEKMLSELGRIDEQERGDQAADAGQRARLEGAGKAREDAAEALAECRREIEAKSQALSAARLRGERAKLVDQEQRVQAAVNEIASLDARLAALAFDDLAVREARELVGRIATASARVEAQAAVVSVAYVPGGAGRITHDGVAVADGARLLAERPLVLEIEGIGRVTITPPDAGEAVPVVEALARDRDRLAAILAAGKAADLHELEARDAELRAWRARRDQLSASIDAIAPEGVARLTAERERIERSLADLGRGDDEPGGSVSELEARLEALRAEEAEAHRAFEAAQSSMAQLAGEAAGRAAREEARRSRRAELLAELPPEAQLGDHRATLRQEASAASLAYDEALRAHGVWTERAPDQAGLGMLEEEVSAAQRAIAQLEQDLAALREQRSRVEGALAAHASDEDAGDITRLIAEAERAAFELEDIAEEVAALQLLDRELVRHEQQLKNQYLAPVMARMKPYVDLVFPGASLGLEDGFRVEALIRKGEQESVQRLSEGTREQIAVLVRLGFGRLLAEQGLAAPLILDDALVYSDDVRIADMQRALELAAEMHQVIVLTCREQSFKSLAGHRVGLRAWVPERV